MTSPGTALPEVLFQALSSTLHEPWAMLLMLVLCIIWRCIPHLFRLLQQVLPHVQKERTAMRIAKLPPKQARRAQEALRALNDLPEKEDRE